MDGSKAWNRLEKLGREANIELVPAEAYSALWKMHIYRLLAWKTS